MKFKFCWEPRAASWCPRHFEILFETGCHEFLVLGWWNIVLFFFGWGRRYFQQMTATMSYNVGTVSLVLQVSTDVPWSQDMVVATPVSAAAVALPWRPVQQTDGTSAVDTSQHGLQVTWRRASELVSARWPEAIRLETLGPNIVPWSRTKIQPISALIE